MDSIWNTPHSGRHFPSQGNWVIRIIYVSCKFLFGNTELLTILSVPREENPDRWLQINLASLKEVPPGTIINADGIFLRQYFLSRNLERIQHHQRALTQSLAEDRER